MFQHISAALLLRVGLGFVLLYAAWSSFVEPLSWIGFFPDFLFRLGIKEGLVLGGFSFLEIGIALWLLWGKKLIIPSLSAAALLLGVALFNIGALDILFRDIGLAFAAFALFVLALQEKS